MSASTNTIAGNPSSKHLIISTEFKIFAYFSSRLESLIVAHSGDVRRNDVKNFVSMLMNVAHSKGLNLPDPRFFSISFKFYCVHKHNNTPLINFNTYNLQSIRGADNRGNSTPLIS